ncbi:unnamed protein product [Cuscuta campestris]|uniref:Uncharacterized protein n=1 Tax=Cuscuta campestris TaxID=132261 RepID=A0A484MJ03_9ASTE|nr:unnamed protein product [Cuscuta campestris]
MLLAWCEVTGSALSSCAAGGTLAAFWFGNIPSASLQFQTLQSKSFWTPLADTSPISRNYTGWFLQAGVAIFLEEKLKGVEAHNRELQDLIARQLDEMANLSAIAGRAKAETLQLKEENLKLAEDLELKEREFPGKAKQWVGENLEETAQVITSTPEVTMEAFKFIYREPNGKEMVTQVGSYGFMSGQKRDREATHAILADRDPAFSADAYGLTPIPDEEPEPPFPLK